MFSLQGVGGGDAGVDGGTTMDDDANGRMMMYRKRNTSGSISGKYPHIQSDRHRIKYSESDCHCVKSEQNERTQSHK